MQDGDILLTPILDSDRSQTILMIPNLQTEDAGNYWCKARNAWGEINATFPVKVYGKQLFLLFGDKSIYWICCNLIKSKM